MQDLRIMLDDMDFRALVAGGAVERELVLKGPFGVKIQQTIRIALSDIGWLEMFSAVRDGVIATDQAARQK